MLNKASYCYLCDMFHTGRGCDTSGHHSCETARQKFQGATTSSYILPPLIRKTWGHVDSSCVRTCSMLWLRLTCRAWSQWQGHYQTDLQYQARGCGHSKVNRATGKVDMWNVLVVQSEQNVIYKLKARPKLTYKKLTQNNCREWKLTTVNPHVRSTWRSGVRSASQLPGREPTDVDYAPAPAH